MFGDSRGSLPLSSLNHISIVCKSLQNSLDFYQNMLGFSPIRRPESFDFDGAWLFNYGIGIHLLQSENPNSMRKKKEINPKDNHISFQCESMAMVERRLKEMGVEYVQRTVEEDGIQVEQLFFHDPDGFMVEICNCDNLPIIPLVSACQVKAHPQQQPQPQPQEDYTTARARNSAISMMGSRRLDGSDASEIGTPGMRSKRPCCGSPNNGRAWVKTA